MLCSRCGKNEANVYYKQILHNKVTEFHFCAACAKHGLPAESGGPAPDPFPGLSGPQRLHCPDCGMRYGEFRESGYLGCPNCYEAFAVPLKDVLEHIHGASRHTGKRPLPREDAAALSKELDAAVRGEKFEAAARLRDRLKALEK